MHSAISSTMEDFCWLNLTYTNAIGSFSWLASWKLFKMSVIVSSGKYDKLQQKNKLKLNGKALNARWAWVGFEPTRLDVLFLRGDSSLH